jgi:hypothetical protein
MRLKEANMQRLRLNVMAAFAVVGAMATAHAQDALVNGSGCKAIHADLVEDQSSVGCKPGHTTCFLGEVDGNHGLRGNTYFRGETGAAGPSTSPGFRSYTGLFEYHTARGTLIARETGVVNNTQGTQDSGVITAFQRINEAIGEFAGVTGYFFVSGFNINQHIVTKVTGHICFP